MNTFPTTLDPPSATFAMAPSFPSDPQDPVRKEKAARAEDSMRSLITSINFHWDLKLELPRQNESPGFRAANKTMEDKCVFMIKMISFKDGTRLIAEIGEKFDKEARINYTKWVHKPRAERGVVPEKTRHMPHPLTSAERQLLLDCLHEILEEIWLPLKTPKRFIKSSAKLDDSPLTFPLTKMSQDSSDVQYPELRKSSAESKRARDEPFPDITPIKKVRPELLQSRSMNAMPPPDPFPGRGRSVLQDPKQSRSANTSFQSETSSVFSRALSSFRPSTQDTIPDEDPYTTRPFETKPSFMTPQPDKTQSSDYLSSSFEARMAGVDEEDVIDISSGNTSAYVMGSEDQPDAEELSQDFDGYTIDDDDVLLPPAERELKSTLRNIFPAPFDPQIVKTAPFYVLYEITRVFLHAEVPLSELNAPVTSNLKDYDTLWKFLESLPALREKPLPEKCSAEVWKCALSGQVGPQVPILAGSMTLNPSPASGPLLKLQLEPLKVDKSHRLDRRLGNDRFLEICMPQLMDNKLPGPVARLKKSLGDDKWTEMITDWLIDSMHLLLGRRWQAFFIKPKEKKSKRRKAASDAKPDGGNRYYFFAVDGFGFVRDASLIADPDPMKGRRPIMFVDRLLKLILPIRKNGYQPFLKLFSRVSLAVSRNTETVVLEQSQIRFRSEDIKHGGYGERGEYGKDGEKAQVMNDGAARMSPALALKIATMLCLTSLPSGFQGRLGEAKGFWVVDHTDKSGEEWIEIYPSQQKWTRSTKPNGESDDRSHRAFEVLKWSVPPQSADVNEQFLPLILERATDKDKMRNDLSDLCQDSLNEGLSGMQAALLDPYTYKKWVRDHKSNIGERVKFGAVPYRAGLPLTIEERLNVMLDAGFEPKKLNFMVGMTRDVFKNSAEDMKHNMHIPVGKSVYALMVPDFWDVLEPDEVYMDLSNFTDSVTGFSGALLNDNEVLVARNPAHFPSDIQKVRAVVKKDLMGLKDVIVFSTKGTSSLADKLSGGDYDGDIAYVCFEPRIVDNFVYAEKPKFPDLVKEGLLTQDTTTYDQLVLGQSAPTPVFLKKAFAFNMQPNMLGIVTAYKDTVRFTQGRSDTQECLYLSQLCSNLVDQCKQGYKFDHKLFKQFKEKKMSGVKPWPLPYKNPQWVPKPSTDIVSHLRWVTSEAIDKSLTAFWSGIQQAPWRDETLLALYKLASDRARRSSDWKAILDALDLDLKALKASWADRPRSKDEESTFNVDIISSHEQYRAIRPAVDNAVTQVLLFDETVNSEYSQWELLKASTLFASYRSESSMPWYLAGRQLCWIKSRSHSSEPAHAVTAGMYASTKPDSTVIRLLQAGRLAAVDDNASIVNLDDLAEWEDE